MIANLSKKIKNIEDIYDIKNKDDLEYIKQILIIENEDKKDDTQRYMVWACLIAMLIYPFLVIITELLNLDKASSLISDMSDLYFITTSAIIMAFFGANTFSKFHNKNNDSDKSK